MMARGAPGGRRGAALAAALALTARAPTHRGCATAYAPTCTSALARPIGRHPVRAAAAAATRRPTAARRSPNGPAAPRTPVRAAAGARDLLEAFSSSSSFWSSPSLSALTSVADLARSVPPVAYFWSLLAAGFGAPVSEDALCVFAGTVIPTLEGRGRRTLVACLYLGVVLSDAVTFLIGRALRWGVMEPIRRRITLVSVGGVDDEVCEVTDFDRSGGPRRDEAECLPPDEATKQRRRKRDRIRARMERSGDWAGFVTRFSIGVRGPLMLLSGFTGTVSLAKFVLGSAVGGAVTLSLQLLAGYALRDRPETVVGAVAGATTFLVGGPVVLAAVSWVAVRLRDWWRDKSSMSESSQ